MDSDASNQSLYYPPPPPQAKQNHRPQLAQGFKKTRNPPFFHGYLHFTRLSQRQHRAEFFVLCHKAAFVPQCFHDQNLVKRIAMNIRQRYGTYFRYHIESSNDERSGKSKIFRALPTPQPNRPRKPLRPSGMHSLIIYFMILTHQADAVVGQTLHPSRVGLLKFCSLRLGVST